MSAINKTSNNTWTAVSGGTIYLAILDRGIFGNQTTIEVKEADHGTPVATVYYNHITDNCWYQIHFVNHERDVKSGERLGLPQDLRYDNFTPEGVIDWICDTRESHGFVDHCPTEDEDYV